MPLVCWTPRVSQEDQFLLLRMSLPFLRRLGCRGDQFDSFLACMFTGIKGESDDLHCWLVGSRSHALSLNSFLLLVPEIFVLLLIFKVVSLALNLGISCLLLASPIF